MKKLKLLLILLLGLFVTFQSCKKKELKTEQEKIIEEVGISEVNDEYAKQFKKEFTVSDEIGNTAFYVAYCKDENELNDFFKNTDFTLTTNDVDIEAVKNTQVSENENIDDKNNVQEDDEDGITVELITTNLKAGVECISLNVKENNNDKRIKKRKYTTSGIFIAVKNTGYSTFYAKSGFSDCWYCSWNWGARKKLYYNQFEFETNMYNGHAAWYKVGVHIEYDTNDDQYSVSYNDNDFRGTNCAIGTLDGANHCYVGLAPSGTTAFMYPHNQGNFYYSPRSYGTKCPYPGSWYDGANCYVCDIPTQGFTYGFIWSNRWYVQPKLLGY